MVDKPLIPRPSFGAQKPGAPLVEPSPDREKFHREACVFLPWGISSGGFVETKTRSDFASTKCAKRIPVSQVSISPEKAPIKRKQRGHPHPS